MKDLLTQLYPGDHFLWLIGALLLNFVIAIFLPFWFIPARVIFFILIVYVVIDLIFLFRQVRPIELNRELPEKLSNGDPNYLRISLLSNYPRDVYLEIMDELPAQLQARKVKWIEKVIPGSSAQIDYSIIPKERGIYRFGKVHVFVQTKFKFVARRLSFLEETEVGVYPSFLRLREYELQAFGSNRRDPVKPFRQKLGHSMEFENIKSYVLGDPQRWLNWKATARTGDLMVNQYVEERSKDVYCLLDRSRFMLMPFDGISLLDYAINATLALAHIAIKSGDRVGLVSFGKDVDMVIRAGNDSGQMHRIMERLYAVEPNNLDSDIEKVNIVLKRILPHRATIIFFTNLEVIDDLERRLPYLRMLSKYHRLVVVFFKNTELEELSVESPSTVKEMYRQTVAENLILQKDLMVKKLNQYGISSLLSRPFELSTKTINAYLEIKRSGSI